MTDDQRSSMEDPLVRELRQRLHRAVAEVQPDPAALPRLRAQVPRRRARHRGLWTGAAVAAALTAAALPTIHGVQQLDLSGGPVDGPLAAGPSRTTTSSGPSVGGGTGRPSALPMPVVTATPTGSPSGPVPEVTTSGSLAGVPGSPSAGTPVAPGCGPADLGQGSSHLGAAEADGRVYGWFRVVNTSGRACELAGGGLLVADSAKVKVAPHTVGGPATGLAAPVADGPVLLPPSTGYQVRFGWVPDGPCTSGDAVKARAVAAAPGPSGSGSPSQAPGPETSPSPVESPNPTTSPTAGRPTVTLTHTPDPGGPQVVATLPNACTGTVYRNGAERIPEASPSPVG
ncbi:hypothetical protein F4556_003731 [Kitasatospora gansuensis]|uniref:DUF4232 domain-containing protein n=1 Tax=Kitasatospora gansuensis TaxID=258050 RepID=A0A7W7WIF3_9ACTN|nr:hypothetical protein [Kitasatospora gansuensis]MBB4948196.1 hypothetical protein [Kitasatospora gansuensis]